MGASCRYGADVLRNSYRVSICGQRARRRPARNAADQLEMKCKGRWRIGLAVRGRLGSSGDQARPDPGRRHRVSYGGTTGTNTAERGPAVGVASAVRWAISVWRSSSAMR